MSMLRKSPSHTRDSSFASNISTPHKNAANSKQLESNLRPEELEILKNVYDEIVLQDRKFTLEKYLKALEAFNFETKKPTLNYILKNMNLDLETEIDYEKFVSIIENSVGNVSRPETYQYLFKSLTNGNENELTKEMLMKNRDQFEMIYNDTDLQR